MQKTVFCNKTLHISCKTYPNRKSRSLMLGRQPLVAHKEEVLALR